MEKQLLERTVRQLAGHLVVETIKEKRALEALYKSLGRTDLSLKRDTLSRPDLSIDKSDLFFEDKIPKKRFAELDRVIEKQLDVARKKRFRMFVREAPIQEHLLQGSLPDWAAGSKTDHTIGPFKNKDGRKLWYDFFPIVKLVALYIQGQTEPALLFNMRATRDTRQIRYAITKGTIWIKSTLLAPTAPAGTYVGLTIGGGRLTLSKKPVKQSGKLTVTASTKVSLNLALQQPDKESNPSSKFGVDAKKLDLDLPDNLALQFSGLASSIKKVTEAKWNLYGQKVNFIWKEKDPPLYNPVLKRIYVPFIASTDSLQIKSSKSLFNRVNGQADIENSGWTLPVATIDTSQPTEAAGIGEMVVKTAKGISSTWQKLDGGGLNLAGPTFLVSTSQIFIADLTDGSPHANQSFALWQDELNCFGTRVELTFSTPALFLYISNANGNELLSTFANCDFQIDRPVKVNGEPPEVKSLNSLLVLAVNNSDKYIGILDDNLLQDSLQSDPDGNVFDTMAMALTNGLFTVTQANGCLLFGSLRDDYSTVEEASLFLTFGLHGYLPTLPDPYAANLGLMRNQFHSKKISDKHNVASISAWLVCRIQWPSSAGDEVEDKVDVSFHFAPLTNQFGGITLAPDSDSPATPGIEKPDLTTILDREPGPARGGITKDDTYLNNDIGNILGVHNFVTERSNTKRPSKVKKSEDFTEAMVVDRKTKPVFEDQWDDATVDLRRYLFALLDVSTAADLFGISFNFSMERNQFIPTHGPATTTGIASGGFPLQVKDMEVISKGANVKAFTVPQISWEPLINISLIPPITGDPPFGPNYYPNDGGPTQIVNSGEDSVALAPLPVTNYLVNHFDADTPDFHAFSLMTLPFGMKALAKLQNKYVYTPEGGQTQTRRGSSVRINAEEFDNKVKGGLQLQVNGGKATIDGQSDMFVGSTVQLTNVLDAVGNLSGNTLGQTVSEIFNREFLLGPPPKLIRQRGVPLTRIDLSGYGASAFSNWLNPFAAFAETSQAKFDIIVGRCAHEIVQVKSMIYPWGIKVVRTITIFRVGSGYVYRFDSGWKAESDGVYDFRYFITWPSQVKEKRESPFKIHPGTIQGLYNVNNIFETEDIEHVAGTMESDYYVDDAGFYVSNASNGNILDYSLQPVYFDADILIDDLASGFSVKTINGTGEKVVPAKKIVGYVQAAPQGIPIDDKTLKNLVIVQHGGISGPIDCEINLAGSGQKMRLNRFDFSNSFGANGTDIVFAVAGRGNMLLPKDGSWSMIKHDRGTGEVSPVSSNLSIPVIREGLVMDTNSDVSLHETKTEIKPAKEDVLLRLANPSELLRQPVDDTVNYGILQNTETQKALFLTPSFETGIQKLVSKSPPLFVDTFRIVNSKAVFPNIGKAETGDIGDAISLFENENEFDPSPSGILDVGKPVYDLMDITGSAENVLELGYNLLKSSPATPFALPTEFELIDLGDGVFRIYIEYKQGSGTSEKEGTLDFNINSLGNLEDRWKSHMSNIGLVVDLGGIDRLMTIRGNWDSKKGSAASYPQPDIKFADELQPIIDILEILQQLKGGNYGAALASGLKLAMSNKAGSWEYKFEASKEIPVLRFPPVDEVYNNPNTPFKLEAGLTLGAYFNSAIQVSTEGGAKLLPSAGGFIGFYGRLSVMCVSLSVGTIYALGQVNLDVAVDTKIGPSLRMKFGFGAQLVIGLPVAGHVSVLFVVGIEIYVASGVLEITAFMLFEGHAEILGGIVSITIRIEAKGTVSKKLISTNPDVSRTDLTTQVTFGLDISIFLVINISFEESWSEQRQIS